MQEYDHDRSAAVASSSLLGVDDQRGIDETACAGGEVGDETRAQVDDYEQGVEHQHRRQQQQQQQQEDETTDGDEEGRATRSGDETTEMEDGGEATSRADTLDYFKDFDK